MQNNPESVGEYIDRGIHRAGLQKKEVAAKVGYEQSALSNILNGRDLPSFERLKNLCEVVKLEESVAFELLERDQRKRTYPSDYKTFRLGVEKATERAMELAMKEASPEISISLSTTWLHTDDLFSKIGVWSNLLGLVDFCEKNSKAKVEIKFMTISAAEIGILVSRRLAFHLEKIRQGFTISGGINAYLAGLIAEDVNELAKTHTEVKNLISRIVPLENLRFEHRNSLAWVGYPLLLVDGEVAVRGMYAVSEGFCTAPATPCIAGTKDYQICERDFNLSWNVALDESDTTNERWARNNVEMIKDYLDLHYRRRIDRILEAPQEVSSFAVINDVPAFA